MELTAESPSPTVVAVLGSCATRDNFNRRFNPTYRESYECALAQNQTSIISLMSEPVLETWQPLGQMSDYDRWNVQTDLSKSFLTDLAEVKPAYLIVDFFADIHFGVIRLTDGRYVTDNRWKTRKTDWYRNLVESDGFTRVTIFKDTDEYLSLWKSAFDRLVDHVNEHTPETRIVIHRGYNTNLLKLSDRPVPVNLRRARPKLSKLNVRRSNQLWRELDDYAIDQAKARVIDLTDTRWATPEEHPWGPFYVHFPPEYNHRFLGELHKIVMVDHLPTWLLQRVSEIERAHEEQHATELADATQTVRVLRRRVEELQSNPHTHVTSARRGVVARLAPSVARGIRQARSRVAHRTRRTRDE